MRKDNILAMRALSSFRDQFDRFQGSTILCDPGHVGGHPVLQVDGIEEPVAIDQVGLGVLAQLVKGIPSKVGNLLIHVGMGLNIDLSVLLANLDGLVNDFQFRPSGNVRNSKRMCSG